MTHIGDYSDQPEIEVNFGPTDSEAHAVKPVRRGQTGLIVEVARGDVRYQWWIDEWTGDTPKKRLVVI